MLLSLPERKESCLFAEERIPTFFPVIIVYLFIDVQPFLFNVNCNGNEKQDNVLRVQFWKLCIKSHGTYSYFTTDKALTENLYEMNW